MPQYAFKGPPVVNEVKPMRSVVPLVTLFFAPGSRSHREIYLLLTENGVRLQTFFDGIPRDERFRKLAFSTPEVGRCLSKSSGSNILSKIYDLVNPTVHAFSCMETPVADITCMM